MTPDKIAAVRRSIEIARKSCLERLDACAASLTETLGFLRRRVADAQKDGGYHVGYNAISLNATAELQRLLVKLESIEERAKELAYLTDETEGGAA